jgi:multisubunit Na+/H+ antiporter MnhF subunit
MSDALAPLLMLGSSATRTAVMWTVDAGLVLIALGMLGCVYRLMRGPHLADRAMAVDTMAIQIIGFVLLLGIRIGTLVFVDGILVLSLLGFAGAIAMAQFIARPHLRPKHDADDTPPAPSSQEHA